MDWKFASLSCVCGRAHSPYRSYEEANQEWKFSTTEKIERINDEIKNDSGFVINTHTNETQCALPFISSKCPAKGEEHAFLMIYTHKHTRNAYHHNFFEFIPFALLLWLFAAAASTINSMQACIITLPFHNNINKKHIIFASFSFISLLLLIFFNVCACFLSVFVCVSERLCY